MPVRESRPRWHRRFATIRSRVDDIRLPDIDEQLDQDSEWCEVTIDGAKRRVRFHDYHDIYSVPGFYEALFYEKLKCCSPSRVASLLEDVLDDHANEDIEELRVLDVGAGNGMFGDEMDARGSESIVGIDIIPEAKDATERDRPSIYNNYFVADLTDLDEAVEEKLRRYRFNCLAVVAALGFGDIPDAAFLKALDLIETPAWLAFNIKERFLQDNKDESGFAALIQQLTNEGIIRLEAYRRYQHRLSIAGEPLHYLAVVARKLKDLPDHLMATLQATPSEE